jgi:hypothetical protein
MTLDEYKAEILALRETIRAIDQRATDTIKEAQRLADEIRAEAKTLRAKKDELSAFALDSFAPVRVGEVVEMAPDWRGRPVTRQVTAVSLEVGEFANDDHTPPETIFYWQIEKRDVDKNGKVRTSRSPLNERRRA